MKKLLNYFQQMMVAATYAEAGEWATATRMTPTMQWERKISWLERVFMAVAFAEADLAKEALHFVETTDGNITSSLEGLGLVGVRMVFGTVSVEA